MLTYVFKVSNSLEIKRLSEDVIDHHSYKHNLKCHYDQILDTHFFTFSYTTGLS